ncbi:hypothetical protein NPIL_476201 [Nephila pilipes]|uniref:Uncharacterized protein n=1 Tax=Nephila pilipes TaxID=299642 RepID=A0A8X6QBA6_NEPPI|nr:hypothetical protein NPIL_476201 [Nephila pilipes]
MVPLNIFLKRYVVRPSWAAFSHPTGNQFLQVEIDKRGNKESAVLAHSPAILRVAEAPIARFSSISRFALPDFICKGTIYPQPLHPMPSPCLIWTKGKKREETFSIMILCRRETWCAVIGLYCFCVSLC